MYIHVALQAVREFLKHHVTMRFPVTLLTLRNVSVFGMAFCTRYLTMFACRCSDLVVSRCMTSAADIVLYGVVISDLKRTVHRVTCQTILYGLISGMRFVAFHASGDISVFVMMTLDTLHHRVFARVCLKYLVYLSVTVPAGFPELRRHSHLGFWCVRIGMACRT